MLSLNDQFSQAIEENAALKSDLESANDQIANLNDQIDTVTRSSMTDPLTSIGNRAAFDRHTREAVQLRDRRDLSSSLVMIDIDRFKSVNDTYGHAIGDEVLKVLASVLKESVRGSDFVARYGEEFAAILFGAHQSDGEPPNVCERLAAADLGKRANKPGKRVTASFSVSELAPGMSIETWMELATRPLPGEGQWTEPRCFGIRTHRNQGYVRNRRSRRGGRQNVGHAH